MFKSILQHFIMKAPIAVLSQLVMNHLMAHEWIDKLFEEKRNTQYHRELLFSTVVEIMSLVAVGLQPSVYKAAQKSKALTVSIPSLYEKIRNTDLSLMCALVQEGAARLIPLQVALKPEQNSLLPGYSIRILDGNHLAKTHKRIKPLRGQSPAALPGVTMVSYDPDRDLVMDLDVAEDAYIQEQHLFRAVVRRIETGTVLLADRNFCTRPLLHELSHASHLFLIRESSVHPQPTVVIEEIDRGCIETGTVSESWVDVPSPIKDASPLRLRRIILRLKQATRDGEWVIHLLTNLPETVDACALARLYRNRWEIEVLFHRLQGIFQSEIPSLGQPRAALLAFAVSLLTYNVLSVVQRAMETAHPKVEETTGFSLQAIAQEIQQVYRGMHIVVLPELWAPYLALSIPELAREMIQIAKGIEIKFFKKHITKPKKYKAKVKNKQRPASTHVSTARVLAQQKRVAM